MYNFGNLECFPGIDFENLVFETDMPLTHSRHIGL